ncbi:hypothetical protein HDV06_005693 [Boothiomyces sp. JEL0866]|nr:hypothetical protein HDV06_005693 [Boothiomyces sp. JEL0866]
MHWIFYLLYFLLKWTPMAILFGYLFKVYFLPFAIQNFIEIVPLNKDPLFHSIHLREITDYGFELSLINTIRYSKLPVPFIKLKADIPLVVVYDQSQGELLGKVELSSPVHIDGQSDIVLKQTLKVQVCDSVEALQVLINKVLIGGPSEIAKITLRLQFSGSFTFFDLIEVKDIACGKTINMGKMMEDKKRFREMKELEAMRKKKVAAEMDYCLMSNVLVNDTLEKEDPPAATKSRFLPEIPTLSITSPPFLKDLCPNPQITPFAYPGLLGVNAGLDIEFSKPPGLNFNIGRVKFETLLNGSCVANCIVDSCCLTQMSKTSRFSINVTPTALSHPITGPFRTARGLMSGAISGTYNGVVYGEWGAGSIVLGIRKIRIENEHGNRVLWLNELVDKLEFEQDIDAVRYVGAQAISKTSDLSAAIQSLAVSVLRLCRIIS